jgi:NAD(P)-dependent dehydrogenase (short-subunit alcohol dehydrogenase family)
MEALTGKVILIVGASRGWWQALALEFARRRSNLILNPRSASMAELAATERAAQA